jgi:hypothetical protein
MTWYLIVHVWFSDGTFGTVQGGAFRTRAMCEVVGKDFLKHFPHTTMYDCERLK